MTNNHVLRIASLLSLFLLIVHLADDVVRGMFPPTGPGIVYACLASGVLLYAVVVLAEHRWGLLIMLLVSLFSIAMPVLHTRGHGVTTTATSSGGLFFIWTIMMLGALGTCSFILSLGALWGMQSRSHTTSESK